MDAGTNDRIAGYRELKEAAQSQLDRIAEGWRFSTGAGNAPMRDVTDEYADRERRVVATMTALIERAEREG